MKTRAEIYANEAADLLRTVTMYPGLSEQQLLCFHPGKEDIAKALLSHLERQGRIFQADSDGFFLTGQTPKTVSTNTNVRITSTRNAPPMEIPT